MLRRFLLRYRLIAVILLHVCFAAGSLLLAFLFRFDFTLGPGVYPRLFALSLPLNVTIFLVCSAFFNLYQGIWHYVSVDDLKDIVKASAVASLVFMFAVVFSGQFIGYPRSIYVMNFALFVVLNGGTRFAIRIFRESFAPMSDTAHNVLIVGAGAAGNEIAKSIKVARRKEYIPVGFIDDDASLHGKRLQGIKVLGDTSSIGAHIKRHRVHEVFIAIPEAGPKLVREIMESARIPDWEVKFKIAPSMLDIMSGKYQLTQIRDVSINDLLSRPNITLDDDHVRKQIAGKSVLITGSGGSIGSEICYQVAAYGPARMILLDASEEHAYNIDQELKSRHRHIAIHTVVGSILDTAILDMLLRQFPVDFIYHAAAYKHVHLMEYSPLAGMKNNVLGTALLAQAAERHRVKQFVMISTDKAVNPRGMMGVTKRLAERVVLERHPSATKFNVVRFGNVLGSSGSVIPLFQKQIREGRPVTVTSPETRRFFMSIPEAVQLVLQASSLNEANAIFVLEMGEPIRIVELARHLIELSGLRVGEDIEIVYTGMRPGEKIAEELLTAQENVVATAFDKITLQRNQNFDPERIKEFVRDLQSHLDSGNIEAMYEDIRDLIPEMKGPSFEEVLENMFA